VDDKTRRLRSKIVRAWDIAWSQDGNDAYLVIAFATDEGGGSIAFGPTDLAELINRVDAEMAKRD
jgi:hypothetical protein